MPRLLSANSSALAVNWWGSGPGIQIRRRLTRPDATAGPIDGSSAVDAIDPQLVKSLERHKLTKVESRNRPGQTFELLKIPIELTVACDDLAKTEETKSNMSCASLSFCPWRRGD